MPPVHRSPTWVLALCLGAPLLELSGCAEGQSNGTADAADAAAEVDPPEDSSRRDLPPDPVPDLAPDPDLAPELAGECEPFSITCSADGLGIQRCSADGSLFEPTPCDAMEVCDDSGEEPVCVACTPDVNCPPPILECVPDSVFCLDYQTAARCDSEGFIETESGCGLGRCFGGGCNTLGNDTGEACSSDSGCAGRTCLCGTDDPVNTATALCQGNLAAGYCTTADCQVNGCRPEDEVCADFALSGAFGGDHLCLLREDCGQRLGSCDPGHRGDGHVCRELPVTTADGSARTWELGCWVPPQANADQPCADTNCLAPIGAACSGNSDCIGGFCLDLPGDQSYCAATCDEAHACPSYAVCVSLEPGSETHFCLARAHPDDCPRMDQSFDIGPVTMTRLDGISTATVCYYVGGN